MDIVSWNINRFWNSYSGVDRDKGARIGWELRDDLGTFTYTFPTKEEVGSDQFIIEESVNLQGAYIRTAYYFEWNSKRKAVSGVDGSDDDWDDDIEISLPKWIDKLFGTDGHHTPDGITILIGLLGALGGLGVGLGGALGGGIGGGFSGGVGGLVGGVAFGFLAPHHISQSTSRQRHQQTAGQQQQQQAAKETMLHHTASSLYIIR